MSTETVADFTSAAIMAAAEAAGHGGKVIFPDGEYICDGLQNLFDDQTWEGNRRRSKLKLSDTSIKWLLELKAKGLRMRGFHLHGNREVNPHNVGGITGNGFDFDIEDFILEEFDSYGIAVHNADLIIQDFLIRNTGNTSIFAVQNPVTRDGPYIARGKIDRINQQKYANGSGIQIYAAAPAYSVAPIVRDVRIDMPNAVLPNNVCLEFRRASGGLVEGCTVRYGRIGISIDDSIMCRVSNNGAVNQHSYCYEVARSHDCIVSHNNGIGNAVTEDGVSLSQNANFNHIIGNKFSGLKRKRVNFNADCKRNHIVDAA